MMIGKYAEVVGASNKMLIGIKGKIIDETMNMVEFENCKKILKKDVMLNVNNIVLNGKMLIGKVEESI